MIKKTIVFNSISLLLIIIFCISCRSEHRECVAYRLQNGCDYMFDYDGKLRTYLIHDSEFVNLDEFKKRFSWDIDTSFTINNSIVSGKTDSLIFVFDDIETTTCMKFALFIHGETAESYVHFPVSKTGYYSFTITETERIILDALVANVSNINDGLYYNDSHCTSTFQIRLFGNYGSRDFICISDMSDFCDNLLLARDFLLVLNNRYCIEENKISSDCNNPFSDYFYNNEIIKEYYTTPTEPIQALL